MVKITAIHLFFSSIEIISDEDSYCYFLRIIVLVIVIITRYLSVQRFKYAPK